MTSDNILKIIEFRERYKAMRNEKEWLSFNRLYSALKNEMALIGVKDEEVMMDDEAFNTIVDTKPEIKAIIDDCYHAVESDLIQQSNK